MGRYSKDRNKQSGRTTFIITILASLLIGISGTYYVVQNFNHHKVAETDNTGDVPSNEMLASEKFPIEEPDLIEEENGFADTATAPEIAPSVEPVSHKSGLPDLLSSDDVFRKALIKLSPGLMQWLNTNLLIRKYVVIANDFSQGTRIYKHVSFLRFDEPFTVEQGENGLQIAPKTYRRYDQLAQAINAMDTSAIVAVYQQFRPLMLQVFTEFGYPKDMTLETIVKKAAGEIIAAPVIEGQHALVRPSLYYKFADPNLEALNPVHKQMLRMGAENTRIIQNKCREFLVELAKSGVN
jgi:hypothetical protein